MNNPITEKSVRFLAQPYTIAALLLYAVNEFILQRHFPSVISGKLSDFAWLFIAPVILTLLLSLIFPSKRTNTVPILAFALTAIGFTAIKTIPAANAFLLHTWQTIFHHPAAIAMDATDLLALLVLPLSWLAWRGKESKSDSRIYQAALIISFLGLLTLAIATGGGYGIIHLHTDNNQLVVDNGLDIFCSSDGGYHWQTCNVNDEYDTKSRLHGASYTIQIPDSQIQYRMSQKGVFSKSDDGGITWHKFPNNIDYAEAAYYYQQLIRPYSYVFFPGAYDMVYDQGSGNVVVAMGLQGILVIPENGKPIQVAIGENQPVKLIYPWVLVTIMFPFCFLAALYTAICFGTLITISSHFLYWTLNLAAMLLWIFAARVYDQSFSGISLIFGLFLLAIVVGLITVILKNAKKNTYKIRGI